jgi:hypothetical protein
MDEEAFRRYIAEFNAANFDALVQYYADDVVFSFNGGLTLHGRDAIVAFYRPFRQAVQLHPLRHRPRRPLHRHPRRPLRRHLRGNPALSGARLGRSVAVPALP